MDFTDLNLTRYGGSSRRPPGGTGCSDCLPTRRCGRCSDCAAFPRRGVRASGWRGSARATSRTLGRRAAVRRAVSHLIVAHEVDGALYERARKDYDGRRGYWLHTAFLGGLWAGGEPCPGGGRVTLNWRTPLSRRIHGLRTLDRRSRSSNEKQCNNRGTWYVQGT